MAEMSAGRSQSGYGHGGTMDSMGSSKRFLTGGGLMGGGTMRSYMQDHLERMCADIALTTKKLELEQRRLYKLNKDLATADAEYSSKRGLKKPRSARAGEGQDEATQKKIEAYRKKLGQDSEPKDKGLVKVRQLERRLEKSISDLNKSTNDNEQLMKQIDQLRKERQVLDTVFKQMTRSIGKKTGELDKLVSDINKETHVSEEAKQKQGAVNKMLERERKEFAVTTADMKTKVSKELLVQKEQAGMFSKKGPVDDKDKTKKTPYMIADEEEAFSETAMHRRILKLSFLNTIQRRHIKQQQKNIEVFEQAFATIKSSTGISDIEEIVKIFIALEQRNFSLLTYVNQLNGEIEAIDIRKRELETSLKNHQLEEGNSKDRKEAALKEMRAQIDKTNQAVAEKDKMIEDASKALDNCRPIIWNVVKYLKKELPRLVKSGYEGDAPMMKQMPPDEHDGHLNHHLMYIEEAILQFRAALGEGAVSRARPVPQAKASQATFQKRPIEPPSAHITGDDSDDDPEVGQLGLGDAVMDRKELQERALLQIQRRKKNRPGPQGRQVHTQDQVGDDDTSGGQKPLKEALAPPGSSAKELEPGSGNMSKSPSGAGKPADGEAGFREGMWWREPNKK
jgi:hypothetical protein